MEQHRRMHRFALALLLGTLAASIFVGCGAGQSVDEPEAETATPGFKRSCTSEKGACELSTSTPTLTASEQVYVQQLATVAAVVTSHARETVAALPSSTPTPLPYKLALISGSCTDYDGYATCEGFVENISGVVLEDIEVLVSWSTEQHGVPISSDDSFIDFNPLLPGQRSPWSVYSGRHNPELSWHSISFKEFLGTRILTRDDR